MKKPREILGDLILDVIEVMPESWRNTTDVITIQKKKDQALAEIVAYYKSKVPKKKEDKLYQCPCDKAVTCIMDEPCLGCETYSEWLTNFHKESK